MRIKTLRMANGSTQKELAKAVGVDPSAVSQWETGVNSPRVNKLPKIAAALGCTVPELFGEKKDDYTQTAAAIDRLMGKRG